ncbi:hypothetical protein KY290_033628 [Solanum tuberosum]|uniref:Uncharacterized protein n=1 Tax=Solanum tuberosum TaxID=4113 RepID=A0ABQ7U4G4_SOLTU|nr:hypothetical protein KY285_032884 [Solanum tuberosum]KAH0740585.1 hypothetical protein KY290_033628 [Solanum tuberosum]
MDISPSRVVEIFVENTEEDQWNYDVADSESNPLQGGEDLIDVNVTKKSDESDATCEECESFNDYDYFLEEDDMIFDKIIDSTVEWVGLNGRNKENQVKETNMEVGVASNMLAMFPNDTQENDCATSEEKLMSLHVDSDDENLKRFIVFNPTKDLEDPKFKFTLNMIFSNSKEFKWAVESNQDEPFKIKTIGPDHSCGKQRDNKTIDSGFLAKKYVEEFRINPSWGVKEFQTHVMRTYNCTITRTQAYMAKRKALDLITGTKEEQFDMLWDYCAELRRSNPGTTCCKQGFLARCRLVTGVDGCHLKGHQKGSQLLTTIGIDGNDNIYHIAFAIVEGFGGQALKDILWKAARTTTEPEFSKYVKEMEKIDSKAP